ncbi:MAG: right-handed parallel beta-helix repeat-containing protein [Bacteroidota bacterium]
MKKNFFRLVLLFMFALPATAGAQIGINPDNSPPDPSAILDIKSFTKGFLTPRMTQAERDGIADPATSLLIYQTDNTPGYYYNQGIPTVPDWTRVGNPQEVICDSRIPIDSVARFGSFSGRNTAYGIDEPGSYYLTSNIVVPQNNRIGVYIDSDNVTLDLNGYSVIGTQANDGSGTDGIRIQGGRNNVTIKNGMVTGWGEAGIRGFATENCLIQDIVSSSNGSRGFDMGENSVLIECSAFGNGGNGFEGQNGCNFIRCTAGGNTFDGFASRNGSQFVNCNAYSNGVAGIDANSDITVLGCVASNNGDNGIDVIGNGLVQNCVAYDNSGDGINVSFSSRVAFCMAANNSEDGIQLRSGGAVVYGCVAHNNDEAGINASSGGGSRTLIENNGVTDNDSDGIRVEGTNALVISNRASGNTKLDDEDFFPVPSNYDLSSGTNFGPILQVENGGDLSTVTNGNHPYANFEY